MASNDLSRRAVFAGIPAAAIGVTSLLPVQAGEGAALAAEDPIIAAIERHKAAEVVYTHWCEVTDSVAAAQCDPPRKITLSDRRAFKRAEDASQAARDEFIAMVPTHRGEPSGFPSVRP